MLLGLVHLNIVNQSLTVCLQELVPGDPAVVGVQREPSVNPKSIRVSDIVVVDADQVHPLGETAQIDAGLHGARIREHPIVVDHHVGRVALDGDIAVGQDVARIP